MHSVLYNYQSQGRLFPIRLKWQTFHLADLPVDIAGVREACKNGCPHHGVNGGCPPYSPDVEELLTDRPFVLLAGKMLTKDTPVDLEERAKLELINKLLTDALTELGYRVKDDFGFEFLPAGPCRVCQPCTIDAGCPHPDQRVYSITGVGLELGAIIEKQFGEQLEWFQDGHVPSQMVHLVGLVPPRDQDCDWHELLGNNLVALSERYTSADLAYKEVGEVVTRVQRSRS